MNVVFSQNSQGHDSMQGVNASLQRNLTEVLSTSTYNIVNSLEETIF